MVVGEKKGKILKIEESQACWGCTSKKVENTEQNDHAGGHKEVVPNLWENIFVCSKVAQLYLVSRAGHADFQPKFLIDFFSEGFFF